MAEAHARGTHEPTGEPESLFGDRARRRPAQLDERPMRRRRVMDVVVYKPKTKETSAAYEYILNIIQRALGGQEPGILQGAADEILATLKDDTIEGPDKKKEIHKLLYLRGTGDDVFDSLAALGNKITDYQEGGDIGQSSANGDAVYEAGVAVEFEDDEESDFDMVQEDDEDDDDTAEDGVDDEDMQDADESMNLSVQDINAYWLQRKIALAYEHKIEAQQSQKLAEEVHLDFDKFSLVKYLLRNRRKIVWCTRLARSESQEERQQIEGEMMGLGPEYVAILDQLHATRASAKESDNVFDSLAALGKEITDYQHGDGGDNDDDVAVEFGENEHEEESDLGSVRHDDDEDEDDDNDGV